MHECESSVSRETGEWKVMTQIKSRSKIGQVKRRSLVCVALSAVGLALLSLSSSCSNDAGKACRRVDQDSRSGSRR